MSRSEDEDRESKCKHQHEHRFCSFDCEETKGGRNKNLHSRSNNSSRFRKWVVQEGVNKFRVEEFFLVLTEASTKFCTNKKTDPEVLGCCHQCESTIP